MEARTLRADAYQGTPAELHVVTRALSVGPGIRCDAGLYGANPTPPRPLKSHLGPPTYLVADVGRRGVPQLGKRDLQMAKTIARYVHHPKTLRFTFLGSELIVYDANGYYVASPEGAHFIFLKFPGLPGYNSLHQFAQTRRSDRRRTFGSQ